MNENTSTTVNSTSTETTTAFVFCGKGLHYDWRAIVASVEAADLDAELAQMGSTPVHS